MTYRLFAGNRNDRKSRWKILKTKFPGGLSLYFGPWVYFEQELVQVIMGSSIFFENFGSGCIPKYHPSWAIPVTWLFAFSNLKVELFHEKIYMNPYEKYFGLTFFGLMISGLWVRANEFRADDFRANEFGLVNFGLITFGLMNFGLMTFGLTSFGLMNFGLMHVSLYF